MTAIQARDVHNVVFTRQRGHHLHHTRVFGARQSLYLFQQSHFLVGIQRQHRVEHGVLRRHLRLHLSAAQGIALPLSGNRTHRRCRLLQALWHDGIGIGKRGFVAHDGADAEAFINVKAAAFHDAFFQLPTFKCRMLAINIGKINLMLPNFCQDVV